MRCELNTTEAIEVAILCSILLVSCTKKMPTSLPTNQRPWSYKASMNEARCGHSTIALNGKIFAIGGYVPYGFRRTVEVYDPIQNAWHDSTLMNYERGDFAAAEVNGKIYVFGGCDNSGNPQNTVEEFNGSKWNLKASMTTYRMDHAASSVNGKIYVIGGFDNSEYLSTVEEYNPEADTLGGTPWSLKTPMPTPRSCLQAIALNGIIYAIGGMKYDISIPGYRHYSIVEAYDPVTNSWSVKTSMPYACYNCASAVLNSGIYVIGGRVGDNGDSCTVIEYNPLSNIWSYSTPMLTKRSDLAAAALNGKIYACGGAHYDSTYPYNGGWIYYTWVEMYDPSVLK